MDTLVRQSPSEAQSDSGAGDASPPGGNGGPPVAEAPPERLCKACGAELAPEQDWCLECGTARPGRLGSRTGWRAAAAVSGATLMLVCGAVAASYAALTDDAGKKADRPGGGSATPIAQAPAQVPGAPATSVPGTTPPTAGTPTTPTTPTGSSTLPSLPQLPTGTPQANPGATQPPPPPPPPASANPTQTGTTTTTTTNTNTTGTTTTPAQEPLKTVALGADAADLYDPYQRAKAKGDPADAYDKNASGSWFVTTAADGKPMQVGLLIDLEARKSVEQIEFATSTPGFRLEVYGTDGSALPPDILDTRWTHLASRSDVDQNTKGDNRTGDGKEIVKFSTDDEEVRQLVLWFTTPPDSGATVRVRDLVLKG